MNTLNNQGTINKDFLVTEPIKFIFALGVGIVMGLAGLSNGAIAVIYIILIIPPIFYAFQNNIEKVLATVPYLVYVEIYFRASGSILPYLTCQYVLLSVFILLILRKGIVFRLYSKSFVFLFLFSIVEIIGSIKSEDANVARSLTIETLLLFIVSLWASSTRLNSFQINVLLKNLKIAGLWLCGYILAAHITGSIKYNLASSFDATNGLAPVQISAYLGLLCFLFFLSIVNNSDPKNITLNIVFLALSATLMVLSFSRGGVYFIGILVTLYFIINFKKLSNYFMFLLLFPIGSLIYYFVGEATNGLIAQRFAEEGASGRDLLIKIGVDFFIQNPVTGIGTGNFNSEIVKTEAYSIQSGAHNEFIRVIAEHGILGILTYWLFYVILFYDIIKARKTRREYAFYFFVLFCLIIVHNGLKIGLQPVILLLAVALPHSGAAAKSK